MLAMVSVAIIACKKQPVGIDDGTVTIAVSSTEVKTVLDGKNVLWEIGDEVSVFDGVANCRFVTTQSGSSVSFSGEAKDADSYAVLYPYSSSASYDGCVHSVLPSEQSLVCGSFDRNANMAAALTIKSGSAHIAQMKNVGCYLKFTVESASSDIVGVSASAIGGESLSGGVKLSFDSSGIPVAQAEDGLSSVSGTMGGEVIQPGTYYLVMMPSSLASGLRITVNLQNGGSRKYDLPALKAIERNQIYAFTTAVDYDITAVVHEKVAPVGVVWSYVKSHVRISVNKEDGKFAKGEKIVFSGKLDIDDKYPLGMTIFEEGLPIDSTDIELNGADRVLYECSATSAKSFMIHVHPRGDRSKSLYVGAVVAPEEFVPGFSEPADFVEYWDNQKAALRADTPVVKLTPKTLDAADQADYEGFDLEISMPEGNPVRGYLAKPKNAAVGTLPIFMYFHGAGVNQPGNPAHLDNAVKYAKMGSKGVIALDMNAHGYLNDQPQSYYDDLNRGELHEYWQRPLTTRKDYYFRLMCLRMVRALDYLCTFPEWDGERVMAFGSSQGGYQGAAIAGLDSRVKFALIDVPAHVDIGSPRVGRKAAWPGIYDIAAVDTPELIDEILPYFDGANFLRHTTAKIMTEAGLVDLLCPAGCVFAGYNVCPSKDKTIYCYPYRNHTAADMPEERVYDWKVAVNSKKNSALNRYLQ